jgi:TonB family protein
MMRSLLKNQAVPDYPDDARKKGIQGTVILFLTVDESGHVSSATPVSGDPLLSTRAMAAAQRLRFRPYYLNGESMRSMKLQKLRMADSSDAPSRGWLLSISAGFGLSIAPQGRSHAGHNILRRHLRPAALKLGMTPRKQHGARYVCPVLHG